VRHRPLQQIFEHVRHLINPHGLFVVFCCCKALAFQYLVLKQWVDAGKLYLRVKSRLGSG
jgi:hypothetical protein